MTLVPARLRQAPIHTNWASPGQYQAVGEELRNLVEPSAVIDVYGEVGTIAYYSERLVVDSFADQRRINAGIGPFTDRLPEGLGWLSNLNFAWRAGGEPFAAPSYVLRSFTRFDPRTVLELGVSAAAWNVSSTWSPHTRLFLVRVYSTGRIYLSPFWL